MQIQSEIWLRAGFGPWSEPPVYNFYNPWRAKNYFLVINCCKYKTNTATDSSNKKHKPQPLPILRLVVHGLAQNSTEVSR